MAELIDALDLIERLEKLPIDDPKFVNYVSELKRIVESEATDREELNRTVQEYQAAYEKLTAPANRVGSFLRWVDSDDRRYAQLLLGDSEYISEVDPKLDFGLLKLGVRVRLNEAYAVVGILDQPEVGSLQRVAEVLSDGRLRLGSDTPGSDGRLVLRSDELADETFAVGDEIRLDSSGRIAIEHFSKRENRDFFFEEVPEIRWTAVGGQEEAIRTIRETIETPLIHPELYAAYEKSPPKGILLYGPPGCGKTLLGKATAHNLTKEYSKQVGKKVEEYFMMISGPKILNMWLGETERMVREIFQTARAKAKEGRMVFIFMDEAESVLRTRSSGKWLNISNTVVPQFCAELDGLVALENVVLMLTSNRPDYIDPAILRPERIDRKIKINRPDKASSKQILSIYLHANLPLDSEVASRFNGDLDCARLHLIDEVVEKLWSSDSDTQFLRIHLRNGKTETLHWKDLVSGALLKSVVDRSKDTAIRRAISEPKAPHGITANDLLDALSSEFKENEIFPKSETAEDWLKLLDYEPDQVVSVRPIERNHGAEYIKKSIF